MRRRVFAIFTSLSMLLAVLFAAVWVRGFSYCDLWRVTHWNAQTRVLLTDGVQFFDGRLVVFWQHWTLPVGADASYSNLPSTDWPWTHRVVPASSGAGFYGHWAIFLWSSTHAAAAPDPKGSNGMITRHDLGVRIGILPWIFAILPAAWVVRAVRSRRKHNAGCCPVCGYDLCATPDRCPECGQVRSEATTVQ